MKALKQKSYLQALLVSYKHGGNGAGYYRVTCAAKKRGVRVPFDWEYTHEQNAAIAAHKVANELNWLTRGSKLLGGQLANGDYVFTISCPVLEKVNRELAK